RGQVMADESGHRDQAGEHKPVVPVRRMCRPLAQEVNRAFDVAFKRADLGKISVSPNNRREPLVVRQGDGFASMCLRFFETPESPRAVRGHGQYERQLAMLDPSGYVDYFRGSSERLGP